MFAHENLSGSLKDGKVGTVGKIIGKDIVFDFEFDPTMEPKEYIDAAVTNLFYWNNMIHDLFYVYGFNERSGNFQRVNPPKTGGRGNDEVIANAQDGSGFNNANFATPP